MGVGRGANTQWALCNVWRAHGCICSLLWYIRIIVAEDLCHQQRERTIFNRSRRIVGTKAGYFQQLRLVRAIEFRGLSG